MGSSICEPNTKGIDASVGGLVWVRRRNGSWWPGRIMGLDELSADCLVSPRSGTPVKLLGREDGSMDWYNLEKSKRVKAFRCGEYDECIEKAKASAANSCKQAVKYARREDAILHALELEAARRPSTHKEFCLKSDNSAITERCTQKILGPGKDNEYMIGRKSTIEGNSTQEISQSGISFEDPTPKVHSVLKKRRKTPNDSEDDGTEGTKRMRGLEDLGMGLISERRTNWPFHIKGSHDQLDNASLSESNIDNSLSSGSPVNSNTRYCSSLKRRQYEGANLHENLKRKNRHRPLTKVLESTTMVAVPIICDQGASPGGSSFQGVTDGKVSALESTESKKTDFSVVTNNNSESTEASCEKETSLNASEHNCDGGVDAGNFHLEMKENEFSSNSEFPEDDCSESLFDVPFVGEGKDTGGFTPLFPSYSSLKLPSGAAGRQSSQCSKIISVSLRNEGLDESGSTIFVTHANNVSQKIEKDTSKWQVKGKRNSRYLSKRIRKNLDSRRSVDKNDQSDASLEALQDMDGLSVGFGGKTDDDINTVDGSLMSDNCAQRAKTRLVSKELGDVSLHWNNGMPFTETRIEEPNYFDSIESGRRNSGNKEVAQRKDGHSSSHAKYMVVTPTTKARNELFFTRNMPVSSLMSRRSLPHHRSRFTNHSGYQIVDAPTRNACSWSSLFDVKLDVQASYRGRHVPLVSLMSKLNGKAIIGHPLTVQVLNNGYCDRLLSGSGYYPTSSSGVLDNMQSKNMSDQSANITDSSLQVESGRAEKSPVKHLPVQAALSLKKSPKIRKCGFLSKKTRKLSSFTVPHDQREEERTLVVEKLRGPLVACVPLKVVFSRINEALNCSTRTVQRSSTSNDP